LAGIKVPWCGETYEEKGGPEECLKPHDAESELDSLWSFGAIGCAIALALAAVLSWMLAAALTLAIVLTLASVLAGIRGLGKENTGICRNCAVLRRLRVHANIGATEKACDCGGHSE
jgi:hypothetical protein